MKPQFVPSVKWAYKGLETSIWEGWQGIYLLKMGQTSRTSLLLPLQVALLQSLDVEPGRLSLSLGIYVGCHPRALEDPL